MLKQLSYFIILGKPLVMWLGIITFLGFLSTFTTAYLSRKQIINLPLKCHIKLALISLILAIIHGILAISAYL